jgi:lysophospholipase L1-like esterase
VGGREQPRQCYRDRADAAHTTDAAHRRAAGFILVLLLALLLLSGCQSEEEEIADFNGGSADIVFLGDSITLGYLASRPSNTFTSRVTAELDKAGLRTESRLFVSIDPWRNLEIAGAAMAGDPDVIVVELGVHSTLMTDITEEVFRAGYRLLLDCIVGGDTVVVVGTVPWLAWDRDSREYEKAAALSEIIKEEAAQKDVKVADLWTATTLHDDFISGREDRSFLPPFRGDSFHPGDAGHALIARLYLEELRDALERPPDRPYERTCR